MSKLNIINNMSSTRDKNYEGRNMGVHQMIMSKNLRVWEI